MSCRRLVLGHWCWAYPAALGYRRPLLTAEWAETWSRARWSHVGRGPKVVLGFARDERQQGVSATCQGRAWNLVGGGPAPYQQRHSAATIRALLQGVDVLGIRDGFDA